MAKLVVLTEGLTGLSFELKGERTTVGRVDDNAFKITEASISSHHAEVLLQGSDVIVKDLNSTNGTFINGEKITEATLKGGQILRLGQVEMRLEGGVAAPPTGKKPLDRTMVIPQGVKVGELELGGTKPVSFEKDSGFHKKSDKASKIFIWVAVALGVVILAFLVFALLQQQGKSGP